MKRRLTRRLLTKPFTTARATRNALLSTGSVFLQRFPAGHFHSPIPTKRHVDAGLAGADPASVERIPGIDLREDEQLRLFRQTAEWFSDISFASKPTPQRRYYLDNVYFSYADAFSLYGMLRTFTPNQIIEIGSGFSSAAMLDISDQLAISPSFIFVDPHPTRFLSLIRPEDKATATIHSCGAQSLGPGLFARLQANDFLFIDSSHIAKIGSDVNFLILDILPCLNAGVVIHFHDIPWPFEYPRRWYQDGRCWNEAYILRAFLQFNDAFEILMFNSFLSQRYASSLRRCCPFFFSRPSNPLNLAASSLWLRKR